MPSSKGGVDGDGEEGVDVVDVVGAKGINIVFSFTLCNNFKLLDLEVLLPHKYALVHHESHCVLLISHQPLPR